jgi:ribulose-phosphate 3-epimerase
MIEVIPAIMPKSFDELKEKISSVVNLVPIVQIDVMDGLLVPNKSWPYVGDKDRDFEKIISEDGGMPFWQDIDFEIDLMIKAPDLVIAKWVKAGVRRIIFHAESIENLNLFFEEIHAIYNLHSSGTDMLEIGLALDGGEKTDVIKPYLDKIDFVQFMGIAEDGFQGKPFERKVLGKIEDIRKENPNLILSVDGGVNIETAPDLVEVGVNRLVIGSAIFESGDLKKSIEYFESL